MGRIKLLAESCHEFVFPCELYDLDLEDNDNVRCLVILPKKKKVHCNEGTMVKPEKLKDFDFVKIWIDDTWYELPKEQSFGEDQDYFWLGWGDSKRLKEVLEFFDIEPPVMDSLVFNVPVWSFNERKIKTFNVFESLRVKWGLATYRAGWFECYESEDWCRWVFGDTAGRVEWEVSIGAPFDEGGNKKDIYELFILPNKELLKKMVDSVPVKECEEYIEKEIDKHSR